MTIPFEKLKAHLPANPKVRAEYNALAPEATGSKFHVWLSAA
jgi:hypothetical protein